MGTQAAPVNRATTTTDATAAEPSRGRRGARGGLYACGAMLAVGSSAAVSPLITGYPLLAGQGWRYLVAGLLLGCARSRVGRRGGRSATQGRDRLGARRWARLVLLAATGMAGFNLLLLHAVERADPGTVGAVVGATPVVLALAGPLGEHLRPAPRVVTCAALMVAGVCVIQLGGGSSEGGLVCAVGALACESCFSLLAVPLVPVLGPRRLAELASLTAAPMLFAAAAVVERRRALCWPTQTEWLAFGYLTLVVTALAFYLWYAAIGELGVDRAGLFAGIVPLTAALLGAPLGTGRIAAGTVSGALVVAGAVLYGVRGPTPRRKAASRSGRGINPPCPGDRRGRRPR